MQKYRNLNENEITIEVCAISVESAIVAQEAGAKRIEFCDNIIEGGTTPSAGSIVLARKNLEIDLCILIRPRGGDFLYNEIEFETMKEDILMAKKLKADGVVIGVLNKNGFVDMKRTDELIKLAKPMEVVFHRAFDMCAEPFEALDQLIELKIDRLLTSGQKQTALEGADLIKKLISKANDKIEIMPGSGIKLNNFTELMEKTKAQSFHLTGSKKTESQMYFRNNNVLLSSTDKIKDYEKLITDIEIIKKIVSISKSQNYDFK
ncbi:MAG: copper homeostasis protein CutC [Bacteroidetes bacterium]|jgi:copper homeostasis protein|nr:copper homeostasis protein CutC [Bacteroidota bacterium]MBT6685139.1 copper homeostasis protein CutC [Bacteroidota bacterium]MBT7142050.1 copper homeostasis protein CutC [Bacteroidota bacterium]MBT7493372.1 copper homeostasis protein CutC [Bacteroidota bacterium]